MYIIIKWQVFSGWEPNNFSPLMLLQWKLSNGRNETNISFSFAATSNSYYIKITTE